MPVLELDLGLGTTVVVFEWFYATLQTRACVRLGAVVQHGLRYLARAQVIVGSNPTRPTYPNGKSPFHLKR